MSVILGNEIESVEAALAGHSDFKLVAFAAGRARELELGACRDPLPLANPATKIRGTVWSPQSVADIEEIRAYIAPAARIG